MVIATKPYITPTRVLPLHKPLGYAIADARGKPRRTMTSTGAGDVSLITVYPTPQDAENAAKAMQKEGSEKRPFTIATIFDPARRAAQIVTEGAKITAWEDGSGLAAVVETVHADGVTAFITEASAQDWGRRIRLTWADVEVRFNERGELPMATPAEIHRLTNHQRERRHTAAV